MSRTSRRANQSPAALLLLVGVSLLGYNTLAGQQPAAAGQPPSPPLATSIASRTAGYEKRDGFVPIYLDQRQGRILLEIPRDSMRALLLISQATGLGSNPIGIDRGSDGEARVVRFDRDGERVLVVFENWGFRSSDYSNVAHQRTVEEAFPPSTAAALPLLAQESGRLLVDATDFVLRDWTGVAETLAASHQGSYGVAKDRSSVYKPYTRAFPENTEIDAALTFTTSGVPGRIVQRMTPDGHAVTLRQHLTLLALPNGDYRPRAWDPRVGYFGISFNELRPTDPATPPSPLDRAAPAPAGEPGRSQLTHQESNRVLRGSRDSRADPLGDPGGGKVVGAGVRSRGLEGCFPGGVAPGGSGSHGCSI